MSTLFFSHNICIKVYFTFCLLFLLTNSKTSDYYNNFNGYVEEKNEQKLDEK